MASPSRSVAPAWVTKPRTKPPAAWLARMRRPPLHHAARREGFLGGLFARGGANYSALPTAFRYRDRYDKACTCRPKGSTQSASALLNDFTLRRGDLAMTRTGMRHFDGIKTYPTARTSSRMRSGPA